MAISFNVRLNWNAFWENQKNNPNCELAFMFDGQSYCLCYSGDPLKKWGIYKSNNGCACRGESSFSECLVEQYDKIQEHHSIPTEDEWQSVIDSCYKVLTTPVWDGKSFKDVIEYISFES